MPDRNADVAELADAQDLKVNGNKMGAYVP
jgi:hypothetical protein